MDLVILGEDGEDVAFVGDGCLLEVGLSADLGWGEGCLLERPVVFDIDLVLLEEDEDDAVFAGGGVGDDPLCLFEGAGEWLH